MKIFKRSYTKPIPPDAKILRRKSGTVAQFPGRKGRTIEGRVTTTSGKKRVLIRSRCWYIEFEDHMRRTHTVKAFTDRGATDTLAVSIVKALEYRAVDQPLPPELKQWFEGLPEPLRGAFVKADIIDQPGPKAESPALDVLLERFEAHLRDEKERCILHVRLTKNRILKIFSACDFVRWSDIDVDVVMQCLLELRNGGAGISKRTYNGHVQALKQFCTWAITKARVDRHSPLEALDKLDHQETDRRHIRRAATPDELRLLISTTSQGPELFGMDGLERALLYRFAAETGLRANEIRQLTVAAFKFDDPGGPCITLQAGYSKHREEDRVLITDSLAVALKSFFTERHKLPTAKAFGGTYQELTTRTADMMKFDCRAAGIPYKNETGEIFDFHALRHTFCTNLRYVNPRDAQALARHKSQSMTERYIHIRERDKRAALESLPDITGDGQNEACA